MDIGKPAAEVFIHLIKHMEPSHEWYIGDGKVYAAITYHRVLESLNIHLGIGVE